MKLPNLITYIKKIISCFTSFPKCLNVQMRQYLVKHAQICIERKSEQWIKPDSKFCYRNFVDISESKEDFLIFLSPLHKSENTVSSNNGSDFKDMYCKMSFFF